MKKVITIIAAMILTATVWAQSPEKMSYQAVIRNSSDALVTNTTIGMQISILQGSPSGTAVYTETQTALTNINGLVSIEIGTGTTSDDFSTIDWASGEYFIKTETDPAGGTNYTITGTSKLLSVPYALYAKTAETVTGGINETDPIFTAHPANGINSTNITNWNTAFGWGNHASAGYLINYTETDPIFVAHVANGITSTNITNWNAAFGWGDHSGLYRSLSYVPAWSEITSNPFSFSTPTNDQIIKFNSISGKWENWTPTFITAEVDGSVTNEIELPTQTGNNGKFLSTDGTSPIWSTITKTTIGLGNVENTALSTWGGSTSLTTLGTISAGTWQGTAINASYIGNLPASQITSGIFDNARINWASPGNIGATTPASGAFTSLSANSGFLVSNGLVNIKPSGSSGTNGQVLTTDGTGNATWKAIPGASMSITTQNANYTITASDGLIISNGGCIFTFPTAASVGAGKTIYIYSKINSITLLPAVGNSIWNNSGVETTNPATMVSYSGMYISDGINTWYEVTK